MNAYHNRLLVLDTDEQVLIELERLLQQEGYDATTTWDTGEALALARSRHFDLLLVGDHPPEISASEILRQLQCGRVSLPCVVLLGENNLFDPEFFYSLGARGVVNSRRPEDVLLWLEVRYSAVRAAAAS